MTISIAGIKVGPGHPCAWVAELSNNHNGDYDRAVRLLHAAKAAGATFAKVQCYTANELVALRGDGPAPNPWGAQGWSMHQLYTHAMTPRTWFEPLFAEAKKIKLPLFASVFGIDSLALMERCECPAYKIASLDNQHSWLAEACWATGKPVIASAASAAVHHDTQTRAHLWLYCAPGYPQLQPALTGRYGVSFDGLSYHGTDPWVGIAAAEAGAQMVEAHFHLADEPSVLEANISLDEYQFRAMTSGHAPDTIEQLAERLDRERGLRMAYGQVALYAESYISHLNHGDTISARKRFADMTKAVIDMRAYVKSQMAATASCDAA